MDNQNLNNGMNENNIQTTNINLNNTGTTNETLNTMTQTSNVETLELLDDTQVFEQPQVSVSTPVEPVSPVVSSTPDFNSFIKQPEPVVQNPNELLNAVPKPDMMISSPDVNFISSDELIEEYVGKNYDKISKRKYNLSAFFLGGTYLMYRKMYLVGILFTLGIVALQILVSVLNPALSLLVFIGASLALCLMFNKFYINNAKKNIDKIKKNNTNKSIQELKSICSKKGGTNLIMTIILSIATSILVVVLLIVFSGYLMLMLGNSMIGTLIKAFNNAEIIVENNNPTEEVIEGQDINKYNGVLNYNTGVVINDNVTMGFLQVFTPSTFNSDYTIDYDYLTTPNDTSSKCNFKLSVINNYTDSKTLIDEMAEYNNVNYTTSTTSNKNITWDTFTITGDLKTTHYNATANNNLVYLLEYNIDSNANANICNAFYNGIVNSIEFK